MSTILDRLVEATTVRLERDKAVVPFAEMRSAAETRGPFVGAPFQAALAKQGMSFICEVKKASPSKGVIQPDFDPLQTAREYTAAGADAISVLTETEYFQGTDRYLAEIAAAVSTPCLRKDFLFDPYQIYQARVLGASAVLLIVAILDPVQLAGLLALAAKLGLSVLVEVHDEGELGTALKAGASIIGVNNRDLRDFTVDTGTSIRLRKLVPAGALFVSESGIQTHADIVPLQQAGVDAVLVGESLMRVPDKAAALTALRGEE